MFILVIERINEGLKFFQTHHLKVHIGRLLNSLFLFEEIKELIDKQLEKIIPFGVREKDMLFIVILLDLVLFC